MNKIERNSSHKMRVRQIRNGNFWGKLHRLPKSGRLYGFLYKSQADFLEDLFTHLL